MPDEMKSVGERIGAMLAQRGGANVPAISLKIDAAPVADTIKAALAGSGDDTRRALALATKAIGDALAARVDGAGEIVGEALSAIADEIKAQGSSARFDGITSAIDSHAEAMKTQGESLASLAKAIEALAVQSGKDRTIVYDEAGRVSRVRIG